MPGWNDAIAADADWSDLDFVGMFWRALAERLSIANRQAVSFGLHAAPAAGHYIGAASGHEPGEAYSTANATPTWSIRRMQQLLEGLLDGAAAVRWVDAQLALTQHADPAFDSIAMSLADWRAAAGLHTDGFTRKYPSAGATATAHGLMEPGDYIGPWVWNELRAGLKRLTRTAHRVQTFTLSDDAQWESLTSRHATYADAKAEVAATWYPYSSDGTPVYGYTQAGRVSGEFEAYGLFHQSRFRAPADSDQANPGIGTELYAGLDHAGDLWLWADAFADGYSLDPFESFGQGYLPGWNLVETFTAARVGRRLSAVINPASTPPTIFPAEPAEGHTLTTGFAIGGGAGAAEDRGVLIARWNVPGGLNWV